VRADGEKGPLQRKGGILSVYDVKRPNPQAKTNASQARKKKILRRHGNRRRPQGLRLIPDSHMGGKKRKNRNMVMIGKGKKKKRRASRRAHGKKKKHQQTQLFLSQV